jgi:hypothetical protein
MTTEEASEYAELIKRFDPTTLTEQYKELLGKLSLANLDTKALIEIQSKNVQALTDANRAVLESSRSYCSAKLRRLRRYSRKRPRP